MGYPALKIQPAERAIAYGSPAQLSIWWRQFAHLPEQERWVIYDDAKMYRQAQECQEVPIVEDYREFCSRVVRELEL